MPIVHFFLPDQRGLVLPERFAFARAEEVMKKFWDNGAVFATYPPEALVDITPRDWEERHYILQMKRTIEAAKVHKFSKEKGRVVGLMTSSAGGLSIIPAPETVHIPAKVRQFSIMEKMLDNRVELGAIITRRTVEFVEENRARWVEGGYNERGRTTYTRLSENE